MRPAVAHGYEQIDDYPFKKGGTLGENALKHVGFDGRMEPPGADWEA